MVYKMYAIQDTLVGFMQPMIFVNEMAAERWYKTWLKEKASNPTDMRFFYLGTYEDSTGTVVGEVPIQVLGGGDEQGNL